MYDYKCPAYLLAKINNFNSWVNDDNLKQTNKKARKFDNHLCTTACPIYNISILLSAHCRVYWHCHTGPSDRLQQNFHVYWSKEGKRWTGSSSCIIWRYLCISMKRYDVGALYKIPLSCCQWHNLDGATEAHNISTTPKGTSVATFSSLSKCHRSFQTEQLGMET